MPSLSDQSTVPLDVPPGGGTGGRCSGLSIPGDIPPVEQQVPGLLTVAAIMIAVLGALWLAGASA